MIEKTEELIKAIKAAYFHPPTRLRLEAFAREWGMSFEAAWLYVEQHERQQQIMLDLADLQTQLAEARGEIGAA